MSPEYYIAYLQTPEGQEKQIKVTNPDPNDGSLCLHLGSDPIPPDSWVRLVHFRAPIVRS